MRKKYKSIFLALFLIFINNLFGYSPVVDLKTTSISNLVEKINNMLKIVHGQEYKVSMESLRLRFESSIGFNILDIKEWENLGVDTTKPARLSILGDGKIVVVLPVRKDATEKNLTRLYILLSEKKLIEKRLMEIEGQKYLFAGDANTTSILEDINIVKEIKTEELYIDYELFDIIKNNKPSGDPIGKGLKLSFTQISNASTFLLSLDTFTQILPNTPKSSNTPEFLPNTPPLLLFIPYNPYPLYQNLDTIDPTDLVGVKKELANLENLLSKDTLEKIFKHSENLGIAIYSLKSGKKSYLVFSDIIRSSVVGKYIEESIYKLDKKVFKVAQHSVFDRLVYQVSDGKSESYIGVVFDRFVWATDLEIIKAFAKNIAKTEKSFSVTSFPSLRTCYVYINTQLFLENIYNPSLQPTNPTLINSLITLFFSSKYLNISFWEAQNKKNLYIQINSVY